MRFAYHRLRCALLRAAAAATGGHATRQLLSSVVALADLPGGAITFKGTGEFHNDEETKLWFYRLLAKKLNPGNPDGEAYWVDFLDSPLRTVLSVTSVKKIMYNSKLAGAHMAGTVKEEDLGERLSSDSVRMNKSREDKGLAPR